MNLITPEGTAALHGANKGDRKVTNILHAMTSSGPIQRNTEDSIACKVYSVSMARMKHSEVLSAVTEGILQPCSVVDIALGGRMTLQALKEKEFSNFMF